MTTGTPASCSASRTTTAWVLERTSTAMCPACERDPPPFGAVAVPGDDLAARGQQVDHLLGQVGGDEGPGVARLEPLLRPAHETVGDVHHADPQRGRHGHTDQPRLHVGRGRPHAAIVDPTLTELGVAEQRVEGVEQRLVAAPVLAERPLGGDLVLRAQIGLHVGAPEGVDRLLRSPIRTNVVLGSPNARCMISHCTGSVSWNSSTSTTS